MAEAGGQKKTWLKEAWRIARPWIEGAALPCAVLLAVVTLHVYVHRYVERHSGAVLSGAALRQAGVVDRTVDDLRLLDERALDRLRRQIEARPAVRRVVHLERVFPSSVRVAVEARDPWIAVRMPAGSAVLDRDRVLLGPVTAGTPPKTRTGIMIDGVRPPLPDPGSAVEVPEVIAGAEMAEIVLRHEALRKLVVAVDVSNLHRRRSVTEPDLILRARSGCAIHWGRLEEAAGEELPEEEKIRNLLAVLSRHPGLRGLEYVKVYVKDRPTIRRDLARAAP